MSNWIHEGFLFLHSRELMSKTSQLVHVTMPIYEALEETSLFPNKSTRADFHNFLKLFFVSFVSIFFYSFT